MTQNPKKEFLGFYEQFKDKIFNYCLYRVNFNSHLAEDLTSEIFLKALKNFDSYDPAYTFQCWIYAIAKNHLANHYRSSGREAPLEFAEAKKVFSKDALDAGMELERVMGLIGGMDHYHREVLLMRFSDGMDNSEIARVLGKDEGAVRTQISRAMRELRKRLGR